MVKLRKSSVTKHKRGFFGRVWQVAFWLFQLAMIWLVSINFKAVEEVTAQCAGTACAAGAAIGGGIVAVGGWFVWVLGTLILGILMFATKGKLVTYDVEDK